MTKWEKWIIIVLAVIIVTTLISVMVLSRQFKFPEYIPWDIYWV